MSTIQPRKKDIEIEVEPLPPGKGFEFTNQKAGPKLLEPVMSVEITASEDYLGVITGSLATKRGKILNLDIKNGTRIVKAQVLLAEMFGYTNELRKISALNPIQITVSAPGRICLFGEHQDYLGLSVITAAINRRIIISGSRRDDRIFYLDLPDIRSQEKINLDQPIPYLKERDYFRSSLNVLLRQKVIFRYGYDCEVRGNIPINSGTSSSSALVIAWIKFLLTIASDQRADDPYEIARLAHQAEVLEFNEPGGMMDHFAASFGSILYIDFSVPGGKQENLPAKLGHFVLGDSQQPKDTRGILSRVKGGTLSAMKILSQANDQVTIATISLDDLQYYKKLLSENQFELVQANIINRELTQQAQQLLQQRQVDHHQFGKLLNAHQNELRDRLQISTPKIDRMIEAALRAGALGAKINGSGGGGCMFAYAPDHYEYVAQALARAGGKPYLIEIDHGAFTE